MGAGRLKAALKGSRLIRRIDDAVFGRPFDPTRAWRGSGEEGQPLLRVARFGSCDFRAMDGPHGLNTEVGYPRFMADRLNADGVAVEFSNVFILKFEELPADAESLRRHVKLTGDPDVVLVTVGGIHAYRCVLPASRRLAELRDKISRAMGPFVYVAYRPVHVVARRFGRHYRPYTGTEPMVRFAEVVRREWPGARLVVVPSLTGARDGVFDARLLREIGDDTAARAASLGLDVLEIRDAVGTDMKLRAANGINPNTAGSRVIGEHVAGWLQEQGIVDEVRARHAATRLPVAAA